MEATTEILKGIFLEGHTMTKSIILFPLSIIEIIIKIFYVILEYLKIQSMFPYIIQTIIILIVTYNIWTVVSKSKYRKSCMFILLILTYPIYAEFPEIQSEAALLKIILIIGWITEIIKEYMFFDINKFFNRNMIVMFTMICMILELGINYTLLIILLLLMTVNLLNTSKIK